MPNPRESLGSTEQPSKTLKCAPPLISAALRRIEEVAKVSPQVEWDRPVMQELRDLYPLLPQLSDWLKTEASVGTPGPVNEFLKQQGIPLSLDNMGRDDDIYSAAVLKVLAEWAQKGKQARLRLANGQEVPAVSMVGQDSMPHHITVYNLGRASRNQLSGLKDLAVRIATKTPEVDFILVPQVFNDPYKEGQDVLSKLSKEDHSFRGLVFPMVDLKITEEAISELIGTTVMGGDGKPVIITQAKGYILLQMNEVAARAEAAAALGATRGFSLEKKPVVIIDRPFTVVLTINSVPVMAVPVDYQNMKDPGNIGNLQRGETDSHIYSSEDMNPSQSSYFGKGWGGWR